MKSICIHVSEQSYQEFKSISARTGRPVAELMRQAMKEYLDHERRGGGSILDIPGHASGKQLSSWSRQDLLDDMREH